MSVTPDFLRICLLRSFGASIGKGCVVKQCYVKEPWNLQLGDWCWIGRNVDIDNPGPIVVGSNVCISQHVRIVTGSHDREKESFDLVCHRLIVESDIWICSGAVLLGNLHLKKGTLVRPFTVTVGGHHQIRVVKSEAIDVHCGNAR